MQTISEKLRKWYRANKRDLPWRESSDPYIIWISEIMLQQTRVAQGYDYFLRFTARFPDVKALAEASEDEVLKCWEGLGYYSRARNLHAAAKHVFYDLGGVFPDTYEKILSLKGVGEYTAAAIVSIVWNQPYAVVDGNVYRVLSRLFALEVPIDTGMGKKIFYTLAAEVMDCNYAGEHNQAIMEFGALCCLPRNPDCFLCIFSDICQAYTLGKVSFFPHKQGKTKTRYRYFYYFHVQNEDQTFLHKRIAGDIWQGLYELPLIETAEPADFSELQETEAFKKMFEDCGKTDISLELSGIKHVLSHQILYVTFYRINIKNTGRGLERYKQIPSENLKEYAFPRLLQIYWEKAGGKLSN
ncbi:MAG: A/G-specific adenine glycosylase [Massilibacteroides sp.]|nr:A/G-specific adenine glycosylase [Massilibacteroides sp.]MDD3062205.1 A/G-specific adenine glycosylase [Massilibacteroides sp.]MDD4114431.1 A/G-specific adenine glycosylase [Massilibacteroides sp.]MDD4659723.1 A/G-specific adenine glycosylase [Massilibacteroides sp.]